MIQDIAPHHLDNVFRPGVGIQADSPLLCFSGNQVLLRETEVGLLPPLSGEFSSLPSHRFLFFLDGNPWFGVPEDLTQLPEGTSFFSLQALRMDSRMHRETYFGIYTALQLTRWYQQNRYCGSCASPTEPGERERSLVCPRCGRVIYPHIQPAVIVGVIHGDELLITKYAGRPNAMPALVAGFTEIGETLEETVAREVMEETGLQVCNIRYYKSQPWGIADDLLMGFYCDVSGSTAIRLDQQELKEAVWVKREDITGQGKDYSLTHEMMMTFRDGLEPPGKENVHV